MRHGLLLAGSAAFSILLGCRASPGPSVTDAAALAVVIEESEPPAPGEDGAPATRSGPPSPEEVVARMSKAIQSTPVLHVTVLNRHRGVDHECKGWSMSGRARGEVRRGGKVVFASYTDRRRVQEYVAKAKFVNGTEAEHVLVEYDKGANDGGWFRLVDFDFSCGPGGIAWTGFLFDDRPRLPEVLLGNMQGSKMTEAELNGRPCYWYHLETVIADDKITWDLYVDKATCEPVRQSRFIVQGAKTLKEDVFDYTFEHLASDAGIHWELDPARLKE